MPDFLRTSKQIIEDRTEFRTHGISVEHYVLSTGHRQMILGSAIAPFVKDVWASEFIEEPAAPGYVDDQTKRPSQANGGHEGSQIGDFLDNTTKTEADFEINKGTQLLRE